MKKCEICGKGSIVRGHRIKLRGKYNPQPKSRKYPNLQSSCLLSGKRVLACAKCIKAGSLPARKKQSRIDSPTK